MANAAPRAYFDLELFPGRSMTRQRFTFVIIGVAVVFALMALRLLVLGAWLVLPFMLIDIALFGWAMQASYKSARQYEKLRLDEKGMELVRVNVSGMVRATRIDARRAEVELEQMSAKTNRLWIFQDQRRFEIGRFLSPGERAQIAPLISAGLWRWRRDRQRQADPPPR